MTRTKGWFGSAGVLMLLGITACGGDKASEAADAGVSDGGNPPADSGGSQGDAAQGCTYGDDRFLSGEACFPRCEQQTFREYVACMQASAGDAGVPSDSGTRDGGTGDAGSLQSSDECVLEALTSDPTPSGSVDGESLDCAGCFLVQSMGCAAEVCPGEGALFYSCIDEANGNADVCAAEGNALVACAGAVTGDARAELTACFQLRVLACF